MACKPTLSFQISLVCLISSYLPNLPGVSVVGETRLALRTAADVGRLARTIDRTGAGAVRVALRRTARPHAAGVPPPPAGRGAVR